MFHDTPKGLKLFLFLSRFTKLSNQSIINQINFYLIYYLNSLLLLFYLLLYCEKKDLKKIIQKNVKKKEDILEKYSASHL